MRKIIAFLLVIAGLAAGCGSGDGEPAAEQTTAAPTTTAAPETTMSPETTSAPETTAIIPGENADVDAVVAAYVAAFDSTSDYQAKAPFIDDPSGLEETVEKYLATGETMGGVSVAVTNVVVTGDEASVTYDLLFNNNPTYPNLPGTAVRTTDGWKVPRSVFCSLMSSARVGCPAE